MKIENYLKLYESRAHAEHVNSLCQKILMYINENLNSTKNFLDCSDEIYKTDLTEHLKLLETAALLHDIGHNQNLENHAVYGFKLILDNKIEGFSDEELKIIALLVKYHAGKTPKKSDDEIYAFLPKQKRELLKIFLGILRIADGIDSSHKQKVNIEKICFDKNNQILTFFLTRKIKDLKEILSKKTFFEKVFKIQVLFFCAE